MKKSLAILPLVALLAGTPALAQVRTISETQAVNSVQKIPMQVGRGINLKLPEGTKAYKGWIDNRSIAQVDGDRPFERGASVLHLMASKSGTTNLSFIVKDSDDVQSLYVFELVSSHQKASPIVNITANSMPSGISPSSKNNPRLINASYTPAQNNQSEGVDLFRSGMETALDQGLIAPNSPFHQAILKFISRVEGGASISSAARKTGLQIATVEQLFQLGRSAPRPVIPASTPKLLVRAEQVPVTKAFKPEPKTVTTQPSDEKMKEILARVDELESRVRKISSKVAKLDDQQTEFVAKLNSLDNQQSIFLARLDKMPSQRPSTKNRPITLTLAVPGIEMPELPKVQDTEAVASVEPELEKQAMGGPTVKTSSEPKNYSSSELAQALRYGLTASHYEGDIPNGTRMYYFVNSWIRRVKFDKTPAPLAAKLSGVPTNKAILILERGKINPTDVGF